MNTLQGLQGQLRHEIEFPVVGTYFTDNFEWCRTKLEVGVPLQLLTDPTNKFDEYAVGVWVDGRHIGFVPQRGRSCTNCLQAVKLGASTCSNCGSEADLWVSKGLAYRIVKSGVLEREHGCIVYKLDTINTITITALLVS